MRTKEDRVCHILRFEGPNPYARAGGVASRVAGLAHALAVAGIRRISGSLARPTCGSPVEAGTLRVLYRAADAVLANSGREPFGIVGLETMAVIACTGCTGEDYAVPGHNALVLQTNEPQELVGRLSAIRANEEHKASLRRAARATAALYAWPEVVERNLLPQIDVASR